MIFTMYAAESHLCTVTFIFYTYICIPFLQISRFIRRIITFLVNPHDQPRHAQFEEAPVELDLPVSTFQDLGKSRGDDEDVCSICLTEFDNTDLVNKLPRCGHVFHMECIDKWLDRCQFTCPLCRSFLLHRVSPSPCKMWCSSFST